MQVNALLIGARRYSFKDEKDGRDVSGAKLFLAIPSENSDHFGNAVQELPMTIDTCNRLSSVIEKNAGASVVVQCEVVLNGKYTKLRAIDVQPA